MKKISTKGYYLLLVIFLSLGATLTASAQYSGVTLETGGLYTALAKDANNNLYVTRVTPGTSGATYEVEKYTNGTGTPAVIYSGLTHEAEDFPWGLAVTSTGNVFISTDFTSSAGAIIELTYSGSNYTPSTYQTGRYFSALAVDASDNLYTAEFNASSTTYAVVKYAAGSAPGSAGTRLYNGLKTATGYNYPTGLTVAPNGDVYVSDAFSNVPAITDGGRVYKLTAASSYALSTMSVGNYSSALAVDASGNLYSSENRGTGYELVEYAGGPGSGVPVFTGLHTNGIYYPWGIAVISPGNIFVADGDDGVNGGSVFQLSFTPPTATTNLATSITKSTAKLNGLVNSNGNSTAVSFIYGTSPTLSGATTTPATTGGTVKPGAGNTAAGLTISGLTAATTYYYAVSATSAGGTVRGVILSFMTAPSVSYTGPNTYLTAVAISPLAPTGTAVPSPAYGGPAVIGSGFKTPFGVAADAAGNIYVADYGNEEIKKIPAGGGTPVILLSGFTTGLGVAVDAAGNIYVADAGNATINEYPAGTTTPVALATGFGAPYGIAVDKKGNVYVADYSNSAVDVIPAGGGTPVAIGSGFANPTGVAVDGVGNVYVADYGNKLVKEIPGGTGTPVSIGSGISAPVGVAVDAEGNVFVADYGNSSIEEILAAGGSTVAVGSGYTNPSGVAVDPFGKVDIANYLANNVMQVIPVGGYYLSAMLPAGLTFNQSTGVFSGTPNIFSPAIIYTVTAYNSGGSSSASVNIKVTANTALANLTTNEGAISPAFSAGTTSYTLSVPNETSTISLTPSTVDPLATIAINGVATMSNQQSSPITLNAGANVINTVVIGQDGVTTKTYKLTVTRAPSTNAYLSNMSISNGTLTPAFATATYSYTASVGNGLTTMTVTPTASDPTATITVDGTTVASGTASPYLTLNVGPNTVPIVVTAQDGVTKQTYTLVVTEAKSGNANLNSLKPGTGALSPTFAAATTSYTESVAYPVSSMTITPTTSVTTSTVTVNGTTVTSGTASAPIALSVGSNTINTVVTAQNGTIKTYTITVTRAAPSSNDNLAGLSLSNGTLTPAFAATTTSYTAAVGNGLASMTITPTAADPTATITVNGTPVTSGSASQNLPLVVGSNTITTVVTAQDGVTQQTYTLVVTEAKSGNANLSMLKPGTGSITPAFSATTTSYTESVANSVTSMTVTPTTAVTTSTVTVNGTAVTSGTASGAIALSVGSNTITAVVTAQNATTKTYTLTVTRASGSDDSYNPGISVSTPGESPTLDDDIIVVHQAVSPNGDGINDFLVIDGIQAYPDNKLMIMNRSGQLIYEASGYDNSSKVFDGHSNKNGQMQLPGTYFYQLDYTVAGVTKHKTGFLVLKY